MLLPIKSSTLMFLVKQKQTRKNEGKKGRKRKKTRKNE